MRTCPACEEPLDDANADECPSCGARLEGATEAFTPVSKEAGGLLPVVEVAEVATERVLVVRKGPDVGERFVLDSDTLTVGRNPEADIFLNDVTVSRDHALLSLAAGEVSIEDRGSLNGTYVNGVRVDRAHLDDGDVVQVGTFQMVLMGASGRE